MTRHNEGTLAVKTDPRDVDSDVSLVDEHGYYIAALIDMAGPGHDRHNMQDNARRLAACWNACLGISTEDLERNGVASLQQVTTAIKEIKARAGL